MSFTFTVNTVYVPQDSLVLSTQNGPLHPELKVNTHTHTSNPSIFIFSMPLFQRISRIRLYRVRRIRNVPSTLVAHRREHVRGSETPRLNLRYTLQCGVQRTVQIGDQIRAALDSDRQPYQSVVDPQQRALVVRHGGVGHQARAFREGFHRPERFREREDAKIPQHDIRLLPPPDAVEGDHRTVPVLLPGCDVVLGMGLESRIYHPRRTLV